jgi:ribokinase
MPKEGETITAPGFAMGFGGKGANQAVASALLGAEVAMITKVGDDMFGPNTKKNLENMGIDTTYVETVPSQSSGVAPIFVDKNSKNSILIIKGANEFLKPSDVDHAKERILSSSVVILQLEVALETVYHTIALCEKHSIPIILNPAPADPLLDAGRLKGVDFFAPNETELQTITGMPTGSLNEVKSAAKVLLAKGIKRVLVTLGDKGSILIEEGREFYATAHKVDSVDSTGAGDAFIGCFATYWIETGDVEIAMKMANLYAAFSTMKPGTQKSFLDRTSFEKAMA